MPEKKWDNKSRVAVIDLGSNTFHIIVVELDFTAETFHLLYRDRDFVYLSKDGIQLISEKSIERGMQCLKSFKEKATEYNVESIIAIGTAALRSANNSQLFTSRVHQKLGIKINVISGEREARLIHNGTLFGQNKSVGPRLIMDIGGGSVEFIISLDGGVAYFNSKNVGISILKNKFRNDSDLQENKRSIYSFLIENLGEVIEAIDHFKPQVLVGPSGPFEIIESWRGLKPQHFGNNIDVDHVKNLSEQVLSSDQKERFSLKCMPANRADLAFESFCLLDFVISQLPSVKSINVTPYALKEGVIYELLYRLPSQDNL